MSRFSEAAARPATGRGKAENDGKLQHKYVQGSPAHNLRRESRQEQEIFIWIRRNSLKSPESDE
jgi:hypothetical protein